MRFYDTDIREKDVTTLPKNEIGFVIIYNEDGHILFMQLGKMVT